MTRPFGDCIGNAANFFACDGLTACLRTISDKSEISAKAKVLKCRKKRNAIVRPEYSRFNRYRSRLNRDLPDKKTIRNPVASRK